MSYLTRGRAVAARRAHNPEVAGSSPVPATEIKPEIANLWFFVVPENCGSKIMSSGEKSYEPQFAKLNVFKGHRWI